MIFLVIAKLYEGFSFAHRSSVALPDFGPNLGSKTHVNGSTLLLNINVKFLAVHISQPKSKIF